MNKSAFKLVSASLITMVALTGCSSSNVTPTPTPNPSITQPSTENVLSAVTLEENSELNKMWSDAASGTFTAYNTSDVFTGSVVYKDAKQEPINFAFFVENKNLLMAKEPTLDCKAGVIEVEPIFEGMFLPADSGENGLLYAGLMDDGTETPTAFASNGTNFVVTYKDWEGNDAYSIAVVEGSKMIAEYSGTYINGMKPTEAAIALAGKEYAATAVALQGLSVDGFSFDMVYSYKYDLSLPIFQGQNKERIQNVLERSYEFYEDGVQVLFDFESDSMYKLVYNKVTDYDGNPVSGVCNS